MPSRRRFLRRTGAGLAAGVAAAGAGPAAGVSPEGSAPAGASARSGPGEWTSQFAPPATRFQGLAVGDDGDALLLGSDKGSRSWDLWVGAVAPDGELRWSRTVEEPERLYVRDVVARDGGYTVALWFGGSDDRRLVHFDGEGEEVWHRPLEVGFDRGLVATGAGYLVYGAGGGGAAAGLVEPDGTVAWLRNYDGDDVADLRPTDDGLLLAGTSGSDAWVQRAPDDGTGWTHTYGGVHGDAATACFPRGAGAVYAGRTGSPAEVSRAGMAVRVTAEGDRVWRRTYPIEGADDALDRGGGDGDGLVVAGRPQGGGYRTGRLLVTDEWGRVDRTVDVPGLYGAELSRFGDGAVAAAGDTGSRITLAKVVTEG